MMDSDDQIGKTVPSAYSTLEGMEREVQDYLEVFVEQLRTKSKNADIETVNQEMFKKMTKDALSEWMDDLWSLLNRYRSASKDARRALYEKQDELITSQHKLINLQSELMKKHEEELNSVKSAVESTIKSTVETEIKSYSDAVTKTQSRSVIKPENLNKLVKQVVELEDRNKNVMIFGLEESENENLPAKVSEVFKELRESSRFLVSRVGNKTKSDRPIKVSLKTSATAHEICKKSKLLRGVDKFCNVYIRPDRTYEERAEHKILVDEMKKRILLQPDRRHFISNKQVCSAERENIP